ncbi:MAG: hypothetical protein U0835_27695 [Isosphaeraceae bacterium]
MPTETGPTPESGGLRDRLLDQWEPPRSSYTAYRKEIETMLEAQEKALGRERRMTTTLWIYLVLLSTVLLTGAGVLMSDKVEGTFMAVTALFWLLNGAVLLNSHLINKSRFEVIKEIKGVELRLAALEERLAEKTRGEGPR